MRHRPVLALAAAVLVAAVVVALLAASARAAGPDLGTAPFLNTSKLTYTATVSDAGTTLAVRPSSSAEALRTIAIPGKWGVPRVTLNGDVGGLSRDGRVLVLQTTAYGAPLRASSGFVTLDTRRFAVTHQIDLKGDFAYDALSPNGRILYLIEHFSNRDVLRYRVRAYDLQADRLLPQVIVDKREPNEPMSGMPSARVSSADGRKVFTLYSGSDHSFVHLLDTVARTAFCIDLPKTTTGQALGQARLTLSNGGSRLTIVGNSVRHVVDVKSLRVS